MVFACLSVYDRRMKYLPVPTQVADEARERLADRFDHRLHVVREAAPCRVCLRIPSEPEEMMLMSYQPLPDTGPYAEVGPIFVHARRCTPYREVYAFPADFSGRPLILRAYGYDGQITDARIVEPGQAQANAAELLNHSDVAEIHVRHVSYTCFDFKIVRDADQPLGCAAAARDD